MTERCDICKADGSDGNAGTFRLSVEHVASEQEREIRICTGHLGALAKQLEERWPWPHGSSMHTVDDPACDGACHGAWKWPAAVQSWFGPFFRIVAEEVAERAWGIFRPKDK